MPPPLFTLLGSISGSSETSRLLHITLPKEVLLIQSAGNAVQLLDASSLLPRRTLVISEAFPSLSDAAESVSCISVDHGLRLIIASLSKFIVIWQSSGAVRDAWRVHSSLMLHDDVQCTDCKSGLLAVGTASSMAIYTLQLENDILTWTKKWGTTSTAVPRVLKLSHSLSHLAVVQERSTVDVISTTSGRSTQKLKHPRKVIEAAWRVPTTSSDERVLYTITNDSVLRVFMAVIDNRHHLQLHTTLDPFQSSPNGIRPGKSLVAWLDRSCILPVLEQALSYRGNEGFDETTVRQLHEMKSAAWDVVLRLSDNGTLTVQAIANIDRKPPTLLRHFTLSSTQYLALQSLPRYWNLFPAPDSGFILLSAFPLNSFKASAGVFFDGKLQKLASRPHVHPSSDRARRSLQARIRHFIRTPDGRGLAAFREGNGGDLWHVHKGVLHYRGHWEDDLEHILLFDQGRSLVSYSSKSSILMLRTFDGQSPGEPVSIGIAPIVDLFALPTYGDSVSVLGVTAEASIIHIRIDGILARGNTKRTQPKLTLQSHTTIPLKSVPEMILPIDQISSATPTRDSSRQDDSLLTITDGGILSFWNLDHEMWKTTSSIRTGRSAISMARCSSAKKTVLVVPSAQGDELTIWDSKESQFSSGLEYRHLFSSSDSVIDLDWISTPSNLSILAVGFKDHVVILCQQRLTYFDEEPVWGVCSRIEIGQLTPNPISDSVWLNNGNIAIGAGHEILQYGAQTTSDSGVTQSNLFLHVERQNLPLEYHHPQMLLQCLLWNKMQIVNRIITDLALSLSKPDKSTDPLLTRIPVDSFLSITSEVEAEENLSLGSGVVERLIQILEKDPISDLTQNENDQLIILIRTAVEIQQQSRSLDDNGLRYLISIRSFYIHNERYLSTGPVDRHREPRERIRYRDMIWAFHSESQQLLLDASVSSTSGRFKWTDARALGVFLWLRSTDVLKSQMEAIARNQYLDDEERSPVSCSLFYFALGKIKLVHSLWRQAASQKEQALMLKFLANDFSHERWKTAALKNAYALLGKRRYEFAAAFFLLGGSLKDAVNICVKNLGDFQLAVAIARVVEENDNGPVLRELLTTIVVPLAFKEGNRWLASWAFWLLRRRDLAVQVLVTPLVEMAPTLPYPLDAIGDPHYDDPSLALLFALLKGRTLQAAQGASQISGRTEFNFVLQMSRVLCRMGCHALALDLVSSWSFDRPTGRETTTSVSPIIERKDLERTLTRSQLRMSIARRRSSVIIDMDVPPSRPPSPSLSPQRAQVDRQTNGPLSPLPGVTKPSIGNLFKTAKKDVQVPEFDMNAFF